MPEHQPPITIGVVGARGLVGQEALGILRDLGYASDALRVFGSPRSVGLKVPYGDTELTLEPLESITHTPPTFVLCCADGATARSTADLLAQSPSTIIDNSSAFRMTPAVPLIIPEVNGKQLVQQPRLIANPNCSTIMLLTALNPLRAAFGVRAVQVSTYQAVSGAGRAGLESLRDQTHAAVQGQPIPDGIFPVPCAFDVFEHESAINPDTGFNGEESKMIAESRRIWATPDLCVLPTCVRVPVQRAHAQAITVELSRTVSVATVREILGRATGINIAPPGSPLTPASIAGTDEVHIGRIRVDPNVTRRVLLWACCDQIRKGAALNAVQIMNRLIELRHQSSSSWRTTSVHSASGYASTS
ncbi:MAG: aspartate-semialdehyde dehydrogenase [Phycisphaerales bacterium JB052]